MHPKVAQLVRIVARAFLDDVEVLVMDKLTEVHFIRVRCVVCGFVGGGVALVLFSSALCRRRSYLLCSTYGRDKSNVY